MDQQALGEPSQLARRTGSLLRGLFPGVVSVLTLSLALFLGLNEQQWLLAEAPTATATGSLPVAGPSLLPTNIVYAPTAVATFPLPQTTSPSATPDKTTDLPLAAATSTFQAYWETPSYTGDGIGVSPTPSRIPVVPTVVRCRKQSGWVVYIVRRGDTLSALARRYGISVKRLKDANCLRGDTIYVGTKLLVPFYLPTPRPIRPTATRAPTRTPTPRPTSTGIPPTIPPTATETDEPPTEPPPTEPPPTEPPPTEPPPTEPPPTEPPPTEPPPTEPPPTEPPPTEPPPTEPPPTEPPPTEPPPTEPPPTEPPPTEPPPTEPPPTELPPAAVTPIPGAAQVESEPTWERVAFLIADLPHQRGFPGTFCPSAARLPRSN